MQARDFHILFNFHPAVGCTNSNSNGNSIWRWWWKSGAGTGAGKPTCRQLRSSGTHNAHTNCIESTWKLLKAKQDNKWNSERHLYTHTQHPFPSLFIYIYIYICSHTPYRPTERHSSTPCTCEHINKQRTGSRTLPAKRRDNSKSKPHGKHISCTHTFPPTGRNPDNSFSYRAFWKPPDPTFFPLSAGRPQPRVTWLHGNTVYKDASVGQSLSERRVANVLSLQRLERRNLHMQLTCRAENNNLTTPIISSVVLDMNREFQTLNPTPTPSSIPVRA